jgi:hypothetical protein
VSPLGDQRGEVLGQQDRADDLGIEGRKQRAALNRGDRPVAPLSGDADDMVQAPGGPGLIRGRLDRPLI